MIAMTNETRLRDQSTVAKTAPLTFRFRNVLAALRRWNAPLGTRHGLPPHLARDIDLPEEGLVARPYEWPSESVNRPRI